MLLFRIIIFLILFIDNIFARVDYEDNDLAKICRPLNRQLDILFILDGSGSVSGSTFDTQMAMLNKIVDMVEIGPKKTQIAVMQYSSYTRIEFGFNTNQDEEKMRVALQKIKHISGTTKTGKALDKALQIFKHNELYGARVNQEDVAQVAVVVTDGHSHDDPVPPAVRLRKAGVQILALGIGAHINMGELLDITGDENLAFQNLTSQASLDKFASEFKKIAIGEHCDFSRGPHGAEITCKSDSIEIGVSTVNPFYGHIYIVGQFNHPECVTTARDFAKEVRLVVGLNSCNIQKQFMVNPKGAMFETAVILKFHPHYNTKKDKVFNVRCFYPEKSPKLPKNLLNNRIAVSDLESPVRMPCNYKLVLKTSDQCKLEDARVGDEIVHSWQCDRDIFDSYQSMLIHSCKLIDVNSGTNLTIIDRNGCVVDPAVIDPPEYLEPLSVIAIGRAVKFPGSSLIKMICKLKFCDRLLGECDNILPPNCRKRRESTLTTRYVRQNGFLDDEVNFADSEDPDEDDYGGEEIILPTVPQIVTFAPHIERRIVPPRGRLTIDQRVFASADGSGKFRTRGSVQNLPQLPLEKSTIDNGETAHIRPIVTSGLTSEGQPRVIEFPLGGMDLKLNTQNVAIVSDENLRKQLQRAMITYPSDLPIVPTIETVTLSTKKITSMKTIFTTRITTLNPNGGDPFQEEVPSETKQSEEETTESVEVEPTVRLEQKIAKSITPGVALLESQVLNVRDLETIRDAKRKEKWCKK